MTKAKETWTQIENAPYEISNRGLIRRTETARAHLRGFYVRIGHIKNHPVVHMQINGKKHQRYLAALMEQYHGAREHLPVITLNSIAAQRNEALKKENELNKPRRKTWSELGYFRGARAKPQYRPCASCGKRIINYRCDKCWAAIRGGEDVCYGEQDIGAYW